MKENIVKELRKGFRVEADRFNVLMADYELYQDIPINSFTILEIRQKFQYLRGAINSYETETDGSTYANSNLTNAIHLGKQLHNKLNKLEKIIKKMEEQTNGEFTR